jgi:2-methylisocitrate lyase-like PEP mutase family enzyme
MSPEMDLETKASTLLDLHVPGDPVVLPTVWDPWSAALAVERGFTALTVGSHPVADALGRSDGEDLSLEEMLAQVALIASSVDVAISADLESGYGAEPARLIDGLLEAGAVGFNLEDTVHSEGDRLRSDAEHADLVGALRAAADASGVHVVINARTDLLLGHPEPEAAQVDRAVRRLTAAADAGADVLYPVGIHDGPTWRRLVGELSLPLNAIARPTVEHRAELAALGVGRISFGPFLQRALADTASDMLSGWLNDA